MTTPVITAVASGDAYGVANFASDTFSVDAGTATSQTFYVGFKPRYIKFVNVTDRIQDEWYDGMAAASSIHTVAAGTVTLETTHGITVLGPGKPSDTAAPNNFIYNGVTTAVPSGGTVGNAFTVDATTMAASKTYTWIALG